VVKTWPALLTVLFLLLRATGVDARDIGLPYFETIPGTEEIGNGIITHVVQDAGGLIWFGTPEGLVRYDGYRTRVYRHIPGDPHSIIDDYVRALMPRSDGTLWVATQGGGISIYDPASDRFRHHKADPDTPGALPTAATLYMAEGADGRIHVGLGSRGLAVFDPHSGRFEHEAHAPGVSGRLQHETVRTLLFDRQGDLWLGTGDGLHRQRGGRGPFEHVRSSPTDPEGFSRQYVYALYEDAIGRIWIGTQSHGAAVLDPARGRLQRLYPGPEGVSHPWISGFVEHSPGRIWIHTYGGGIDVVDSNSLRIVQRVPSELSIPGALALDRLTQPYVDRSGLIWVPTWGAGLQRHNPLNAGTFRAVRSLATDPRSLSTANVLTTLPLDPRRVWVGTGGVGIDVLDLEEGVVERLQPDPARPGALRDGTIRALLRQADGTIWVGTQHAGVQRFDPATGRFDEPIPALLRGPVRRMLLRRNGEIVVGKQADLQILDPATGAVRSIARGPGRAFTDPVWSLAEDGEGRLWIGTPSALLVLHPDEAHPREVPDGEVLMRALIDLAIDPQGQPWLVTPRGIGRLAGWEGKTPRFEDYGARLGLPAGAGQNLLFDRQGRLWTTRWRIDPQSGQVEPTGTADGVDIGSVEPGSGSLAENGWLYFGGTRGLLIVDPDRYRPWRYEPPLVISTLEIDGSARPLPASGQPVPVPAGHRSLTLEFSALDYSAPGAIRYAYRLAGADEAWTETDSTQRLTTYRNLWPGQYRFEVRAATRNGRWGAAALSLPITVAAPWWQTWPAVLLALVALALGAHAMLRWRTRALRQRQLELSALIEQRTRELSLAKERAEDTLLRLEGTQKQLVAAEKMASLGQLVAGVAHEINTPIGIALTAASHLEELASEAQNKLDDNRVTRGDLVRWKQEIGEASRLIVGSLQRAGTLVASFKQVSVDQSSGQRRRFRLQEFLREVHTSLQPGLRRTPHRLEIECTADIELDSYPGALFQIITNLVNNAVMHAFTDGRTGTMRIVASSRAGRLELVFADDGAGMSAEIARRAFDPFFTTRRGSGGSGLGLHVVHNLVTQLLGGEIELLTTPGAGCTVRMRMPLEAPSLPMTSE
jgi:signal transduction histidine kinase/ligand-binding sensor domain-containing protein